MIGDHGEIAFMITKDEDDTVKFDSYTVPRSGKLFLEGEVRNAFLAQAIEQPVFEDRDREILNEYLNTGVMHNKIAEQFHLSRNFDPIEEEKTRSVYKYKPVALKTKPVIQELPAEFRIKREIIGDPLEKMPELLCKPPDFSPVGRYTLEQKEKMDKVHKEGFLWPEERKLLHYFMMEQEGGFAWDDTERGRFREDFFPPIDIPIVPHKPWVLKNIPIPPGLYPEVCRIIKSKIEAGVYELSNSSYR